MTTVLTELYIATDTVKRALADSDRFAARAMEDGLTAMTPAQTAYRQQLRALLAQLQSANPPSLEPLVLPTPPDTSTIAADATTASTDATKMTNALAQLETADSGWANLNAAGKDSAAHLCVRVCAALIRLYLRKLT